VGDKHKEEGNMRSKRWATGVLVLAVAFGLWAVSADAAHVIKLGGECDRTGPTKLIGVEICPAIHDYMKLVNKKGGVKGHKLEWIEIEHGYTVDRGVEAYERLKRDGVVGVLDYGTPIVYALTPRHLEDKIPGLTPGFGRADAADGERFPYVFPMAASYWSQMGGALKYLKDQGAKKGTKIAFLYFDNPAGREPIPLIERIAKKEGYEIRLFAVPSPGLEMGPQVIDIVRRMKADWVVTHLFGRSPSVSIKEFQKNGFPLNRVISFVWGAGEADAEAAGWDVSQGYLGLQFTAIGRDLPLMQEIIKMYKDEGQEVPKYVGGVYYSRGIPIAGLLVRGVELALEKFGEPLTGEKVKNGLESMKEFTMGGFLPPLTITAQDHEGGGWVRVYQVKGKEWVPVTEWLRGYQDEVWKLVREAAAKK
jgi:branched-chain amino acid transport system substrate-binding protein